MRRFVLLLVLVGFLASAGTASAWEGVTIEMSAVPLDLGPGDPWDASLTVVGPDGSPLTDMNMHPGVTIADERANEQLFVAGPTSRPGVFHVRIVFPEPGTWTYRADVVPGNPGAPSRTFPPVEIGDEAAGFPVWPVVASLAGLIGILGFVIVRRNRPPRPQTGAPATP